MHVELLSSFHLRLVRMGSIQGRKCTSWRIVVILQFGPLVFPALLRRNGKKHDIPPILQLDVPRVENSAAP